MTSEDVDIEEEIIRLDRKGWSEDEIIRRLEIPRSKIREVKAKVQEIIEETDDRRRDH